MVTVTKHLAKKPGSSVLKPFYAMDFSKSLEVYKKGDNKNQILIGSEFNELKTYNLFLTTNTLFEGPKEVNAEVIINIYDLLKMQQKTQIEVFCSKDSQPFDDLLIYDDEIIHSDKKYIEKHLANALDALQKRIELFKKDKMLKSFIDYNDKHTNKLSIKMIVISGFSELSENSTRMLREIMSIGTGFGYFVFIEDEIDSFSTPLQKTIKDLYCYHFIYQKMVMSNIARFKKNDDSEIRDYPISLIKASDRKPKKKADSYQETLDNF